MLDEASDSALDITAKEVNEAQKDTLVCIVDQYPSTRPESLTSDYIEPTSDESDVEEIPFDSSDRESINKALHKRHEDTRAELRAQTAKSVGHATLAADAASRMVVNLYRKRLVDAITDYSLCCIELRNCWKSAPKPVQRSVKWVFGTTTFVVISAKIIVAVLS